MDKVEKLTLHEKLDALSAQVLHLTRIVEGRESVTEVAIAELKQSGRCPVLSRPPSNGW